VGTGSVGTASIGRSVALSADGNTAIIGGNTDNSSHGAAWIFKRSGGVWNQFGNKLVGNGTVGNAEQGESVSISADGSTAIVGGGNDNSKGAVWVFVLDDSPKPIIVSVQDIAGDQGGTVRLRWNKSFLDTAGGNPRLTSYYVWRKIPPGATPKTRPLQLLGITNDTLGTLYDVLVNVPAVGSAQYNVVAATLYDSSSSGNHDETFIVTGHTADADIFWISDAMTGHSVDNLPPITPMNAQLIPLVNGPIRIAWDADRVDPDVEKYVIYRSTQGGFVPSESTKLCTATDTSVVDYSCQIGEKYYYRVAAVDIHGNQSAPTGELSETAMPVQLNTMTARVISTGNVLIEWTTISEVNNYGFYVERRGEHEAEFTTASDFIPGNGTTLEVHAYSWTDAILSNGTFYYMLRQIGLDGKQTYSGQITVTITGALGVADEQAPRVFSLHQNYPNPFNPATQIKFTVENAEHASVKIYNLMGQEAATLYDGVAEPGRYHTVVFDASRFSSGIYYCRIVTEHHSAVLKMVLTK
jgi:hypothetical protein